MSPQNLQTLQPELFWRDYAEIPLWVRSTNFVLKLNQAVFVSNFLSPN